MAVNVSSNNFFGILGSYGPWFLNSPVEIANADQVVLKNLSKFLFLRFAV
jgi:hypothetical protein